jgi:hypothetical protein
MQESNGKTLTGRPLLFEVGFWEWRRKMVFLEEGVVTFWEGSTVRKTGTFNSSHG